jgi:hypothetical protein
MKSGAIPSSAIQPTSALIIAPARAPPPTVRATKPSLAGKRMRRRKPAARTAEPSRVGVKPWSAGNAVSLSSEEDTAC